MTLRWWNDLWLNEGFASYVEYLGADAAEPTWSIVSPCRVDQGWVVHSCQPSHVASKWGEHTSHHKWGEWGEVEAAKLHAATITYPKMGAGAEMQPPLTQKRSISSAPENHTGFKPHVMGRYLGKYFGPPASVSGQSLMWLPQQLAPWGVGGLRGTGEFEFPSSRCLPSWQP